MSPFIHYLALIIITVGSIYTCLWAYRLLGYIKFFVNFVSYCIFMYNVSVKMQRLIPVNLYLKVGVAIFKNLQEMYEKSSYVEIESIKHANGDTYKYEWRTFSHNIYI